MRLAGAWVLVVSLGAGSAVAAPVASERRSEARDVKAVDDSSDVRSPAKQRAATRAAPRAKTKPAPVKQRDGGAASPSKPAPKAAPVKRPVTKDAPDASGKDAPGKDAKETEAEAGVVKVESDKEQEGMKTYTFGPQEVEGRLRSPQIQYFLRRVRAEFAAGELGHRSFMRELSHTRYHRSVR